MVEHSSISNSEHQPVPGVTSSPWRPSFAFWIAACLCLLAGLVVRPLREIPDHDNGDFTRFVAAERHQLGEPGAKVLLMGSSRTQYGIDPEMLAKGLGYEGAEVRLVAMPMGSAWEALQLLHRNPESLQDVRYVFLDVMPVLLDAESVPTTNRFCRLARMGDRWSAPLDKRFQFVSDWFWPHTAVRQTLRSHGLTILEVLRKGSVGPDDDSILRPQWAKGVETEALREQLMGESPNFAPDIYARETFRDFRYSKFQERALEKLIQEVKARGGDIVIHQPPFHPAYIAALGEDDSVLANYVEYLRSMRRLEDQGAQVLLWSLPEEIDLPEEAIVDFGHFGREAAERYTQILVERVQASSR